MTPRPITVDFETDAIEPRPDYPPAPIGVGIKYPGKRGIYYAFDHASENTHTKREAVSALREAYRVARDDGGGLLFQNARFDLDVADTHFPGLKPPPWQTVHDTLFLLFLDDPRQQEIGLKPSAERLLGIPPDERDAVAEWLVREQPVPNVKITASVKSANTFMRYLRYAPGRLVARYGVGDLDRTARLFKLLYPRIVARGMLAAYDRERELAPILLGMDRHGVPVALRRLEHDVEMYTVWREKVSAWLLKKLDAPSLNLDSSAQLLDALLARKLVDSTRLAHTASGKLSAAKDSLAPAILDAQVGAALRYRTALGTTLEIFMRPWLAQATRSSGRIFTTWNQVKAYGNNGNTGTIGARSGRLSASRFMNIPKRIELIWSSEVRGLPSPPVRGLPPLPHVRGYIEAPRDRWLIDRDYSQQEPRIVAHFDGGHLMRQYNAEPWIDFHDFAREELERSGLHYDRKLVKNTNLGLMYGMGVGKLADKNNMTVEEATRLKRAVLALYPGLREMYRDVQVRAHNNEPIRTWGGREYFCEDPRVVNGRPVRFDYRLVNSLIQGSAADCTKEAVVRYVRATRGTDWPLLLLVHDELVISAPKTQLVDAMEALRIAMESVEFDVPMLSEGAAGARWDALKPYDTKGKIVWRRYRF